ncbi:restriction endonuclease [Streptomyces sp. MB09-01]|uniref:restriction endonuclease n=1 Tax=Streptomyces sp. MB09-01 TaxID=3028666 RepID=UPI0029B32A24|nr:restriction endonuclease [Streptomyces sp. MB09-01]MDX3533769.1 restriction endonuclease [Streptomyces sp. MB09-01]
MGRDVVLAVGLVGICLGGAAVFVRAAVETGRVPVLPIVTVIVLAVGVALARWSIAPGLRRSPVRRPSARGPAEQHLTPEAACLPEVDSGALDHTAVDADGFEHTVAALCARDGCPQVEVVGGAGDLGADVIATTADGLRVVIQCKHYGEGNRVGSQDLQRFGGTCFAVHEADVAVVVTTSDFTAPAAEYADACNIVCVDGDALAAWTESQTPPPWEAAAVRAEGMTDAGT